MDIRDFAHAVTSCYPDPPGVHLKSVNGLQVEGGRTVSKVAFGVFLNDELIAQAVKLGADAIVCHHGYSGEGFFIVTGPRRNQLKTLMGNGVSVIAVDEAMLYHSEHPTASLLAREAGLSVSRMVGTAALCVDIPLEKVPTAMANLLLSIYPEGQALDEFRGRQQDLAELLGRAFCLKAYPHEPEYIGPVRVFGAWERPADANGTCRTGPTCRILLAPGCHSMDTADIHDLGVDLYVVGEVREHPIAEARELGITILAVGHYYSERPGVQHAMSVIKQKIEAGGCVDCPEFVFAEVPSTL